MSPLPGLSRVPSRFRPLVLLFILAGLLPFLLAALGRAHYLTQLTMAGCYSLAVLGLCLLMGYAGQISLGSAGFFAIGGYVIAVLTTVGLPGRDSALAGILQALGILVARRDPYGAELLCFSPAAAVVAALAITAAIALVIGIPVLRLKGHYLAMATLAFGLIVQRILLAAPVFGGADGINDVPPLPLAGLEVSRSPQARLFSYGVVWLLVCAVCLLAVNLIHSRVGRALRAIHVGEDAASSLGIDSGRYKLRVFLLSALLAALGGVLLTHYIGGIGPSEAASMKSIRYVAMVAAGGMSNLWGSLLSSSLLSFLSLRGLFGTYDDAVFGGILLAVMLFLPEGVFSPRLARLARMISGFRSRFARKGP